MPSKTRAAPKPHSYRLRIPPELFEELNAEARANGVSINTLIIAVLASTVQWRAADIPTVIAQTK